MADDGAIETRRTQSQMSAIHSNLKDAIGKITAGKTFRKEQRQGLKRKLLKVYQDVVEESVRGYVKVSSEGLNSVSTAGNKGCTTSTTGTDDVEVMGSLTQKRSDEVDMMFCKLEGVIKSCSNKRKCYPQQISQLLDQTYHHWQDILEKYVPAIRSDSGLSANTSTVNSTEELESCAQRIGQASSTVTEISKTIPTIMDKADRLLKSYEIHRPMEEAKSDPTERIHFTRKRQRRSLEDTLAQVSNSLADRSTTESPKPSNLSRNTHKRKSNSPRCLRRSSSTEC